MPYICLANSNIPGGVLQIPDLWPNTSQYVPAGTPGKGQTGYINRSQNDTVIVNSDGTLGSSTVFYSGASAAFHPGQPSPQITIANGIQSYLLDRVQAGGTGQAIGSITVSGSPHNGDTLTVAGVVLTCVENFATATITISGSVALGNTVTINGVVLTAGTTQTASTFFDTAQAGSAAAVATSLIAAIGLAGAGTGVTAASGGAGVVALTATTRGTGGEVVLATNNGGSIVESAWSLTLAVAASQQFDGVLNSGSAAATATSINATITNAATIALMKTANPTNHYVGSSVLSTVVSLTALTGSAAALKGSPGCMTLAASVPADFTFNAGGPYTGALYLPNGIWNATMLGFMASSLQYQIDNGLDFSLTSVNSILGIVGADLTGSTAGSQSTGTLTDLLSIMAGRGYQIARFPSGSLTPNQWYTSSAGGVLLWNPAILGGFTYANLVFGTVMNAGEIRPINSAGDTVQVEFKPIRYFANTDAFAIANAAGSLWVYSVNQGNWPASLHAVPPVTLFPSLAGSKGVPTFPWSMQPGYTPQAATFVITFPTTGTVSTSDTITVNGQVFTAGTTTTSSTFLTTAAAVTAYVQAESFAAAVNLNTSVAVSATATQNTVTLTANTTAGSVTVATSDVAANITLGSWTSNPANTQLNSQRVITVYNDDGTLFS